MGLFDDLDWIPSQGVWISKQELEEMFVAVRAILHGTKRDEPNRSHALTVAKMLVRAIGRHEGDQ